VRDGLRVVLAAGLALLLGGGGPVADRGAAVTGPGGSAGDMVEITGTPAGRGVVCPLFRLDDGEVISLTGAAPQGEARVVLSGFWLLRSPCQQGRTFRVQAVRTLPQE
jgi:hypothetical protein